jgi:hypothetical protein
MELTDVERELLARAPKEFRTVQDDERALWQLKQKLDEQGHKGLLEYRQRPTETPTRRGDNVVTQWRITPRGLKLLSNSSL